jgi:hypothetical protein
MLCAFFMLPVSQYMVKKSAASQSAIIAGKFGPLAISPARTSRSSTAWSPNTTELVIIRPAFAVGL